MSSQSSSSQNPKPKRSFVWIHFDDKTFNAEQKKVTCKICRNLVHFDGSSTNPLIYHLIRDHRISDPKKKENTPNQSQIGTENDGNETVLKITLCLND